MLIKLGLSLAYFQDISLNVILSRTLCILRVSLQQGHCIFGMWADGVVCVGTPTPVVT